MYLPKPVRSEQSLDRACADFHEIETDAIGSMTFL